MSIYNLLPNFPHENYYAPFVTLQNEFTDDELKNLCTYVETNLTATDATVGTDDNSKVVESIRKSKCYWIENNSNTLWLYDRLGWIVRKLNSNFYNFDLYGFVEHFQYTIYEQTFDGHYTWHIDSGKGHGLPRKLSLVLQLSSLDEYEGGDLEIMNSSEPQQVRKEKGLITLFPSYTLHRVTPVTKGTRKSLVVWIAGPAFK